MYKCLAKTIAIRVHRRTIDMIRALDDSVVLEGNEANYFMLYCAESDHEESETISNETFLRTYEPMPGYVLVMFVNTID